MKVAVVGAYAAGLTAHIPRQPVAGETLLGTAFMEGPGGKGSNQAIAAARLGAEVTILTAVGDDAQGRAAIETWRAEGVDASAVVVCPQAHTMVAFILVEPSGDNRIVVVPGAINDLTPVHVAGFTESIAAADILVVSMEIPLATAVEALRIGRQTGTRTLLNPAPAQALPDAAWGYIDVLTPNQTEGPILLGHPPTAGIDRADLVAELTARTGGAVLLTLGGEGVLVSDGGPALGIPAAPVARVRDTTGAGDAFTGALAVALAEGGDLADAARFAARAGAHAVTIDEVIPSLPYRSDLESES